MTHCPDEGCKEQMEELKLEVKGRPGTGTGIRTCMNKLVPKHWVWKFASGAGIMMLVGGITLYADVQAGKKDHDQNVKDIVEIKENIKEIHTEQDKQSKQLIRIEVLQETVLEEIKKIAR